ncbi:Hypothetical predicted protein [Olea europaea subsp. europaea]|uniref:Uncharacterized protein n=1 Tax=Olea europaea subsp. europaea TaxID=158383 RepID=A0A8S0QZ66_OLEEU|nr:Hypothetical predicted protein [Olea europaea subsp. europaea]
MSDLDNIDLKDLKSSIPLKKVPYGNIFIASKVDDVNRLRYLLGSSINVNDRDQWDFVALYYACLEGHLDALMCFRRATPSASSTLSILM